MNARIAVVTTVELTEQDTDEVLLLEHLPEAELAAWDDPDVDWASYEVVLLRSPWNYTEHLPAFLAWADRVSQASRLHNPLEVIRWNTDKRYLAQLADRGVPIVPTTFVAPGDAAPAGVLEGHVVVKPAVGAGSSGARLFRDDPTGASAHMTQLHADGLVALVQPYMSGVDDVGETALVYLGGQFSHAARKAAILSRDQSWSTGLYADEQMGPAQATAAERELADRVVAGLPELAYARVDLLPSEGGPVLLELELTEPSLFLEFSPGAPARAASAFRALLNSPAGT